MEDNQSESKVEEIKIDFDVRSEDLSTVRGSFKGFEGNVKARR